MVSAACFPFGVRPADGHGVPGRAVPPADGPSRAPTKRARGRPPEHEAALPSKKRSTLP